MVDSPKEETMTDGTSNLPERGIIERKLDALSASVDARFDQVNQRFEQVNQQFEQVNQQFAHVDERFQQVADAIAEQRAYTEFAYQRLDSKMDAGFDRMDTRFNRLERKIDQIIDLHIPDSPPGRSGEE